MEKSIRKKIKEFRKFFILLCVSVSLIGVILSIKHVFSNKYNVHTNSIFQRDLKNYTQDNAIKYSNFGITGTSWLSFRDVPSLINEYVKGKKTLDFGCGAGRSTKFLRQYGLDITGVDISKEFIKQAKKTDKLGKYLLCTKDYIPQKDNSYDFAFSSHVLIMIPTKTELDKSFREIYRILKKDGIYIAVTGNEYMHAADKDWVSYKTDFIENFNVKSGDKVKLVIRDVGATFYDYNWTHQDYIDSINKSGFKVLKIHSPLGKDTDGYKWRSEKETSPYIIYVLQKN